MNRFFQENLVGKRFPDNFSGKKPEFLCKCRENRFSQNIARIQHRAEANQERPGRRTSEERVKDPKFCCVTSLFAAARVKKKKSLIFFFSIECGFLL